jgi:hypothetical protein
MTRGLPARPAPGPLEEYAARFDDLFDARAQREGFRRYLEGLLLSAEGNKTLSALANAEPLKGAQRKEAQNLQWFLSESGWDPTEVNQRRHSRVSRKTRAEVRGPVKEEVVRRPVVRTSTSRMVRRSSVRASESSPTS